MRLSFRTCSPFCVIASISANDFVRHDPLSAWRIALGAVVVSSFYCRAQRVAARVEKEKLLLFDEWQIVLDFMQSMVDSVGERLSRDELFQRIVHASILSTGALSFQYIREGSIQSYAWHCSRRALSRCAWPIADTQRMRLGTRAKFIE